MKSIYCPDTASSLEEHKKTAFSRTQAPGSICCYFQKSARFCSRAGPFLLLKPVQFEVFVMYFRMLVE